MAERPQRTPAGEKVYRLRRQRKLSVSECARRARCTRVSWYRLEREGPKIPRLIEKAAKALGVGPLELF